jgi:ATP-dependent dihydroxyacetone kinase
MQMSQFINSKEKLVTDALDGFLKLSQGLGLARLDGYPHIKVVCRTDHKLSRVAIISGGGSGHEPAHAGFVGKGMLTAAVCGEVFASPSVDAVLAAILAVTGKGGCLLIVKNYTGDRLNFGLAAEKARALGKRVEVVVVGDDVALPNMAQPRGLAGTLFVHKIAGYLAEKGSSLAVVAKAARKVAASTVSLGISLNSCTVPGSEREDRVPRGKAELGLGIHGEPGVELIRFGGAKDVAALLITNLMASVGKAKSYALLLNNLGATTPLEMNVLAKEILNLPAAKKVKLMVGPAPMMTALDMHGISISLLPLNAEFETALKAKVAPLSWPGAFALSKPKLIKLAKELAATKFKPSNNAVLKSIIEYACDVLIAAESQLNALDAKVGDGDTGSTFATAARNLKVNLKQLPLANTQDTFNAISGILSKSMGGSSGVLLAILFAAAGAAGAKSTWPQALQIGLSRMKEYGGAKAGDRTMIDALEPALKLLVSGKSIEFAAIAAREGANSTAQMKRAGAGRSAYVSEMNLKGVIDPGAQAVGLLFEGLATYLK